MNIEHEWYLAGRKVGLADAKADIKRNLSKYNSEFRRGYKETARESWWYRMNNKVTDLLARMGSSLK